MMRLIIAVILAFQFNILYSQGFYELNEIQTIEITFEQNNWDQLLDNAYSSTGDYILAQTVAVNGEVFDSVGVKYKGNSTYNPNQTKNPFHIELDTYKDHIYDGYTDIKLSNVAKDPSFLREVLSYQIIRQYMDAPLSNYANVYVNGSLIGLYSNSESITKKFVKSRFNSKKNTFVKCNPPAGAGPQSNDFPNLVYLGTDSTNYYDAYELKSDTGWDELIDLCDTLANQIDDIETILDVDRALWMLALDNVLVNLDSYIGGFAQNYYLYRDDNGRFIPIIWDLNESFGRFAMTGSGNLNGTTAKQQMSHLLHENDPDFPLIQKLLSVPMYKRMYLAHYKTILLENFEDGSYFTTGEALQQVIDESVQNDDNKFFSYNNFLSNLSTDANGGGGGPGGGATIGIASLMNGRVDYLLGQSDFTQIEPNISDIGFSSDTPLINESISITANVVEADKVFVGYRDNQYGVFQRIEMFDDGMHDDGDAGDNIYGIDFVIENALTQYYIYAENNNTGKFSPQRSEYEYYTLTATTTAVDPGDLVINEFLASNDALEADQDGEFDDWIELYNNGDTDLDLAGYFLSDDSDNLMAWEFPDGTMISAGGYLMIWSDDDTDQEGLHARFKISSAGESIFLVNPIGEIIDEVAFAEQETDISYGRLPNGTGSFQTMTPTFNGENMGLLDGLQDEIEEFDLTIFPNPTSDQIEIFSDEFIIHLAIYNNAGVKVQEFIPTTRIDKIDLSSLNDGIYFLKAVSEESNFSSQMFVKIGQ